MDRGMMRVMYMNSQSTMNKLNELRAIVEMRKPDIIAITETWTNPGIANAILAINGYEIVARNDINDTEGGRGGGVIVYVRDEVNVWEEERQSGFNQYVSVKMKTHKRETCLYVIYRSPNSKRENDDAMCEWIRDLKGSVLIVGDLKFQGIDWQNGTSDLKGRPFYEARSDAFLEQHVTKAMHINGNLLDLVLSNESDVIQELNIEGPNGT